MSAVEGFVAKLRATRADLVRLRREYTDALDGEGVARYQLAIEAVDRAIDDEQRLDDAAKKGTVQKPEITVSRTLY